MTDPAAFDAYYAAWRAERARLRAALDEMLRFFADPVQEELEEGGTAADIVMLAVINRAREALR